MKVIVLAGGGGTRLWPLSREDFPKQFLNFGSGPSLLQKTVQRLANVPFIDEILISTNTYHRELVEKQLGDSNKITILVEPIQKNTAPAIGLAVKYLQLRKEVSENEPILVVPSDHFIEPEAVFLNMIERASNLTLEERIIIFGIHPTKPETGYGYIEIGKKFNDISFEVNQFVEKPNRELAEKYLLNPNFYWNSGMFLFSIGTFWNELETCSPELSLLFQGAYEDIISRFNEMPNLSIDYAVIEKSAKVIACPLAISWSDVGSWDSVYDMMGKDSNRNVKTGNVVDIDTTNSLIMGGKRLVTTVGLEDMLIVETEDALFVSKKGESQRVRALVQELKKQGMKERNTHVTQTYSWGAIQVLDHNAHYTIKKVIIYPGQSLELSEVFATNSEWISLSGKEQNSSLLDSSLFNQQEEPIEYLLIQTRNEK